MKRVLFIDIRNSVRSPIAEAWFNYLSGDYGIAASCGTMPANKTDPRAVQVMHEVLLDISRRAPRRVNQQLLARADLIVLMGKDIHPDAFSPTHIWDFQDLKDQPIDAMRSLRDQIQQKVQRLIAEIQMEELDSISTTTQWQNLMQNILS